ncbi:GTP-binding protein [Microbacterium sp. 2216-1]|uniref:GTP-binding protein n=1 Tax=Microbacterium sp. 2216-1 TaxID=3390053 RepID=UPI0039768486
MSPIEITLITGHRDQSRATVARRRAREQRCTHVSATARGRTSSIEDVLDVAHATPDAGRLVAEIPADSRVEAAIGALAGDATTTLVELVCVVDAKTFTQDLMADDYITASDADVTVFVARALRLVQHIEHASTVLVFDWEAVATRDLSMLLAVLSHLAPAARIGLDRAGAPAGFPAYSESTHQPGWVHLLNDEHDPHMQDARVSAFRYERLRPFHPERLNRLLEEDLGEGRCGAILRSAGFCRLATRPGIVGSWDQVGQMISLAPLVRDNDSPTPPLALGQDLGFIGIDMDIPRLTAGLDSALLDDDELLSDARTWTTFGDPFPRWAIHAHSDD